MTQRHIKPVPTSGGTGDSSAEQAKTAEEIYRVFEGAYSTVGNAQLIVDFVVRHDHTSNAEAAQLYLSLQELLNLAASKLDTLDSVLLDLVRRENTR